MRNNSPKDESGFRQKGGDSPPTGDTSVGRVSKSFVDSLEDYTESEKRRVIRSLSARECRELQYRLAEKILNIEGQIETAYVKWKENDEPFEKRWLKNARYASRRTRKDLSYVERVGNLAPIRHLTEIGRMEGSFRESRQGGEKGPFSGSLQESLLQEMLKADVSAESPSLIDDQR